MYKHIFCLLTFTLLLGCQKDTTQLPAEPATVENTNEKGLLNLAYTETFKEDFLASPYQGTGFPKRPPTFEEKQFFSKSNQRDIDQLRQSYPVIKDQLLRWYSSDKTNYSSLIQSASLRYLRRVFIDDPSDFAQNETVLLLGILVDLEAVDLDVLADSFVKVEGILPQNDREKHLRYISDLYQQQVNNLRERITYLQQAYANAPTETEKQEYMMSIRIAERKALSCVYTKQLLALEGEH